MRNIFLITENILKITFKKKISIITFIILPIFIILFSVMVNGSPNNITKIAIVDKDRSNISLEFIENIEKNDKFKVVEMKEEEITKNVSNSEVDCAIVFPRDFGKSILNGSFNKLDIVSVKGEDTTAWIKNSLNYYIKNITNIAKASNGDESMFYEIFNNYKSSTLKIEEKNIEDKSLTKSTTQQSIGFLIMLMMIGANTTASLIIKEKRDRTYYRIFASPLNSKSYVISNILTSVAIISIQIAIMIFFMEKVFKIKTYVPPSEFFIILMSFALVAVALGIFIVSVCNSSQSSSTLSTIIIVPTCMLSGCFWPVYLMPDFMQRVARFLPQSWVLDAISKIQTGKSFSEILINIFIILSFAMSLFIISAYNFKKNDSVRNFV